ncbi:ssu1p [Saccharomyces arboricola H-6]|uniref:Ssu1p n=1 Tax=Saccharomyces arboricola (strain H-6 / AS 2.3317 / CBS 10644) TaxID=1160507 RepID=J8PH46_SACAR|nr:ssu1p [Saccharomyces arboricola H-6]
MVSSWLITVTRQFDPFMFVMVMGVGISSNILYSFPYPARWLRVCSYIMFGIACLIFIMVQALQLLHLVVYTKEKGFREYFDDFFRNMKHSLFWGTYPMGLVTIINFLGTLSQKYTTTSPANARHLMIFVYVLWWYDLAVCLVTAWGISFLIWHDYYSLDGVGDHPSYNIRMASENMKSVLLLDIIPLVVVASSCGTFTMSEIFARTFNRNIQLITLVICALTWLHAITFVCVLITIYVWSLYINKIPPMTQVFTLFLLLGPMGQGSFGVLLLTDNIRKYVKKYYPSDNITTEQEILFIMVPWCFKVLGMVSALALLAMGYFFTVISVVSIISYYNTKDIDNETGRVKRVYTFHKGFWGMTFPMGTMCLGNKELYDQYNQYVPLYAFRVTSTIYGGICIFWSIYCLLCTLQEYLRKAFYAARKSSFFSEAGTEKITTSPSNNTESMEESSLALDFTNLA